MLPATICSPVRSEGATAAQRVTEQSGALAQVLERLPFERQRRVREQQAHDALRHRALGGVPRDAHAARGDLRLSREQSEQRAKLADERDPRAACGGVQPFQERGAVRIDAGGLEHEQRFRHLMTGVSSQRAMALSPG